MMIVVVGGVVGQNCCSVVAAFRETLNVVSSATHHGNCGVPTPMPAGCFTGRPACW